MMKFIYSVVALAVITEATANTLPESPLVQVEQQRVSKQSNHAVSIINNGAKQIVEVAKDIRGAKSADERKELFLGAARLVAPQLKTQSKRIRAAAQSYLDAFDSAPATQSHQSFSWESIQGFANKAWDNAIEKAEPGSRIFGLYSKITRQRRRIQQFRAKNFGAGRYVNEFAATQYASLLLGLSDMYLQFALALEDFERAVNTSTVDVDQSIQAMDDILGLMNQLMTDQRTGDDHNAVEIVHPYQ